MKININNSTKIEQALKAVNGSASAWTITAAYDVAGVAHEVEAMLNTRDVRKANRIGTLATYSPAGPAAAAYRNKVISTSILLERFPSGWFLTNCRRTDIYPRESRHLEICISNDARADMTRQFYSLPGETE